MIKSREDLKRYLEVEFLAHSESRGDSIKRWKYHYKLIFPEVYFQRLLRKTEYYKNCGKGIFGKVMYFYYRYHFLKTSQRLGLTIPLNVIGPGLRIPHYGSVVVSTKARLGENCTIHNCVNIGESKGKAPIIGNNVYIGPGVKLFGGIKIGDNVRIGANSVVNKDIESNVTVVGIPAKVVSKTNIASVQEVEEAVI